MAEKLSSSPVVEKAPEIVAPNPSRDEIDDVLKLMGIDVELRADTQIQLEARFGDRVFRYGSYSGTVSEMASSCPAFYDVMEQGFDAAVAWLLENDEPEVKVEEDPEKVDDPDEDKTKDENNIHKDEPKPLETSNKDVSQKPPSKRTETNEKTADKAEQNSRESLSSNSAPSELKTITEDKVEEYTRDLADVNQSLKDSPTSKTSASEKMALPVPKHDSSSSNKEIIDKQEQLQDPQAVAEIKEIVIDIVRTSDRDMIVDEALEDIENVNEVIIGASKEIQIQPERAMIEERGNETESFHLPIITEQILDIAPIIDVQPIKIIDELMTVEHIEQTNDDIEEDSEYEDTIIAEVSLPESEDVNVFQIPQYETANELTLTDIVDSELHDESAKSPLAQSYKVTSEVARQELIIDVIAITQEMMPHRPEQLESSNYDPLLVLRQVELIDKKLVTLEQSRTAEECRDALGELRQALSQLLAQLGYANAELLAERLTKQYDTATLKKYVVSLAHTLVQYQQKIAKKRLRYTLSHYGAHAVRTVVNFVRQPQLVSST